MSINVERALMSCIALDPVVVGGEVLAVFGDANPFTNDVVWRVYNAWRALDPSQYNPVLIADLLEQRATYKVDWLMEVRSLMNEVPSPVEWQSYLAVVKNEWLRRKAITELEKSLHSVQTCEDVSTSLVEVLRNIACVNTKGELEEFDVRKAVGEECERLHKTGLVTGISSLDELLGQLEPGEVLTIAARTSVGKSLLAGNIARNLSLQQGAPGLYFSFEMPIAKVVGRMAASLTHHNSRKVLEHYEAGDRATIEAYEQLYRAPVIWDERASLSMNQICNKIRRCHTNKGIKWVLLDHLGFVKLGKGKRHEEIGSAIKQYKEVCKELGIVPIQVVQLNRCAVNEEPGLHHLKGAGDIEEDSSQVVLLHRDTILTNEEREKVGRGEPLPLKVAVAKTRYGETGYRQLALFLHSSLIQDRAYNEDDIPN